ncbi:MAG: OmpH family outer membrane protein [Bacteroidetes bacterium]|nr:OmpH family outer membrane protein [Bacteroidota bacterium]
MRSLLRVVIVLAIISFAGSASAQKVQKIGHVDFAKLYAAIPGQDTIKAKYDKFQKELSDEFNKMQAEYTTKVDEFQKTEATLSNIVKQTKQKEIVDIQQRLEAFQQSASQSLQQKEGELTAPIITRAKKAISEVAKENGFTYIFNTTDGVLLFSENGDDIMPLVKKKLNLK